MDKNYGMELMRATEIAAISAAKFQGLGESIKTLGIAREAMVKIANRICMKAKVLNDRQANKKNIVPFPEFVGEESEKINEFDVILCSIDGHNTCAQGGGNVASYTTLARKGGLLSLPSVPMYKIAVGFPGKGIVDIDQSVTTNIKRVARTLNKHVGNTTVCILDRKRHHNLIQEIRSCGARIMLIPDGDISASIATITQGKIDMLVGIGGAQESVMTSAFMTCLGGYIEGKFHCRNDTERQILARAHFNDSERVYTIRDLCKTDEIAVAATGISDGTFLQGVEFTAEGAVTHSFVARGETKTSRHITTNHHFDTKPIF